MVKADAMRFVCLTIWVVHSTSLVWADDSIRLYEDLHNRADVEQCADQPAENDDGMCRPAIVDSSIVPEEITTENLDGHLSDDSASEEDVAKRLKKLLDEEKELAEKLKSLENETKIAEALANELLEPFRKPIDYPVSDLDFLNDEVLASRVFKSLDRDGDGILELDEVKKHRELFDLNKNGYVENPEVKWYHNFYPARVNAEFFFQNMWKRIGRWYMYKEEVKKSGEFWTKDRLSAEINYMNINYDDEDEDESEGYPKATQKAVLDSLVARADMNKAQALLKSLQFNINVLKRQLGGQENSEDGSEDDVMPYVHKFGPREKAVYFPGRLVCYRYHNFTHIFRLCPFVGAFRNIMEDGNPDRFVNTIILGEWTGWIYWKGEPTMLYKNGADCGGNSTFKTKVKFRCSKQHLLHHRLVRVEELSPCEYLMTLIGPIGCDLELPMAGAELEKSTGERLADIRAKLDEYEKSRSEEHDEL